MLLPVAFPLLTVCTGQGQHQDCEMNVSECVIACAVTLER